MLSKIKQVGAFSWYEVVLAISLLALSLWLYYSRLDIWIHKISLSYFDALWQQDMWGYFSRMGQAWFQILVCAVMAIFYYRQANYRMARAWYLSVPIFLIVGLVVTVMKTIFGRPRPKMLSHELYQFEWWELAARMHSYPSGHTITTFCLLATVWMFYGVKTRVILFMFACVLGYARVGIGSHYMADVIAGAVLGYMLGKYFKNKWKLGKEVL